MENGLYEGPNITGEEWRKIVEDDRDLKITGLADVKPKREKVMLRMTSPLLVEWKRPSSGKIAWFDYCDGEINGYGPDEEMIKKMKEIARKLEARVVGENYEEY